MHVLDHHFSQTIGNVLSYYSTDGYVFLPTTDQGKHQHSSPFELIFGGKALPIDIDMQNYRRGSYSYIASYVVII